MILSIHTSKQPTAKQSTLKEVYCRDGPVSYKINLQTKINIFSLRVGGNEARAVKNMAFYLLSLMGTPV